MFAARIDSFAGDNHAYAGYLLEILTRALPGCIAQLEKQVTETRCDSRPPCTRVVLEFTNSTTPTVLQTKQPSWPQRVTKFFANLPDTTDRWREDRESAKLSSEEDILFTAHCLATARLRHIPFTDHIQRPDLQETLLSFAQNVGEALAGTKSNSKISQFLSLIFVATCCVASKEGHPLSLVNNAQRKLLEASRGECRRSDRSLMNDRASLIWLLQEMQRQFRRGLWQRAFELFFSVSGRELSFYGQCPKEPDENAIFTGKFPRCEVPDEIQASLPLWIPFFVKVHIGDRWSYSTICRTLGVDLLNREEDFHRFAETLKSKKLIACQLE
ncbi:hypothetical protein F5144DRAFT_490897, partial [Chaetomium tenue]